jgi:autotransporter adhesin
MANHIKVGDDASGYARCCFVLGKGAVGSGENAIAIGNGAEAHGKNSMAIGHGVVVTKEGEHRIEVDDWFDFIHEIREAVTGVVASEVTAEGLQ